MHQYQVVIHAMKIKKSIGDKQSVTSSKPKLYSGAFKKYSTSPLCHCRLFCNQTTDALSVESPSLGSVASHLF